MYTAPAAATLNNNRCVEHTATNTMTCVLFAWNSSQYLVHSFSGITWSSQILDSLWQGAGGLHPFRQDFTSVHVEASNWLRLHTFVTKRCLHGVCLHKPRGLKADLHRLGSNSQFSKVIRKYESQTVLRELHSVCLIVASIRI